MNNLGRVVIIGAGPTGLGAAHRLIERGHADFTILEAADKPGGLAGSHLDAAGFTWDVGGHVHYSHYAEYDRVVKAVLGERRVYHHRNAAVWLRGRFVPFPFQYNLHRLDKVDCEAALRDLERARAGGLVEGATGLDQWLLSAFGQTITTLFMAPYNRKVWGYPLDQLSSDWIADRVALPDLDRVRRNIRARRDDVSWGPNRSFYYPLQGGTGAIWSGIADLLPSANLLLSSPVVSVDVDERRVTVSSGQNYAYDTLISSMPLDLLCRMCSGLDDAARRDAAELVHSAIHVVGLGLRGGRPDALDGKAWVYFPEPEAPFYRLTVLSDYSPHNVPVGDGFWSLLLEVCETRFNHVESTTIVDDCWRYLRTAGFISGDAVLASRWHRREERGYPTPFRGRDRILGRLRAVLEPLGVYSRGRFGAWMYEVSNQDHSFMQGVELVNRLYDGSPEPTIERPDAVNRIAPGQQPPRRSGSRR